MHYFIGFDVGGTHIKHGLIDEHGKELSSEEFDTPEDEASFKKAWKEVVETYQKDQRARWTLWMGQICTISSRPSPICP